MKDRQDPQSRRREAKPSDPVQEAAEGHYHRLHELLKGRDRKARFDPARSAGADPSPVLRQGLVELAGLMDKSRWDEAMKVVWRLYRLDSQTFYAAVDSQS